MLALPRLSSSSGGGARLCYGRDPLPGYEPRNPLKLASDEHPRVRLEAVRAASFFTEPEAFEIRLIAAEKPTDKYLDFVQGETRKTLEPIVRKGVAAGKADWFTTDAGHRWYVKNVESATLAQAAAESPNRAWSC